MSKLIFSYILFILLSASRPAFPCMNEYRTQLSGYVMERGVIHDFVPTGKYSDRDKPLLEKKLREAEHIYHKTKSLEDYSDFGVLLVYNGKIEQAKKVFQEIEAQSPGLYATAANIGTVYELLGQNELAHFWIKKALQIDPNSHEGSEWIHLKILEAKIAFQSDPDNLKNKNVLNLDFGDRKKPENKSKIDLKGVKAQLNYQLQERMTFIRPPDPIVAQLLFDLGNITAIVDDLELAMKIYERAREYGQAGELIDLREKYFRQVQARGAKVRLIKDKVRRHSLFFAIVTFMGIASVGSALWYWRARRGRISL